MLPEDLHERIGKLSYVKRQLLNQQLRRDQAIGADAQPNFLPVAGATSEALSYTQESVLRVQASYPDAVFYHKPQVLHLEGPLNVAALQRALDYLWARHDVLGMQFERAGDAVRPSVRHPRSPAAVELQVRVLSPLTSAVVLEDLLHQHRTKPFDLACDPPPAALLVQAAPQQHFLSLVHHFIAFDYWSLELFNRELGAAYNAFAAGSLPRLPALSLTYAEFAAWQRARGNEERLAEMAHFWRRQLARASTLPIGLHRRTGPDTRAFAAGSFEFCVPAGTLRRLERLAQRENATLFMLLLASLGVLLSRYTQRTELGVGTLVANRPTLEMETVLGNFSNRLLLWNNLEGNPSFRQLLRRIRGTTLNAYARQEVPLDHIAAELFGSQAAAGALIPVMFDYVNAPLTAPKLRGLVVNSIPAQCDQSEYPLHVTAQRGRDHLRVRLQMWPDAGLRTTAPHMACHWSTMLAAIAENTEQSVCSLPIAKTVARSTLIPWLEPSSSLSNSPAARL